MSHYDVVIVGGGPAGLQAAMTLGRARRRVLLATAGPTRNAPAAHSHNFFTRDGAPPAELVAIGRAQLAIYPTVEIVEELVVDARAVDAGFTVTLAGGRVVQARKLLLASGMRDLIPPVPGLAEAWGRFAFTCPYCHGFELADRRLAVMAHGADAMHYLTLLRGWSQDLVLLTDGPHGLSEAELAALAQVGIAIHVAPLVAVEADAKRLQALKLADGTEIACDGLFFRPPFAQACDLGARLGAEVTEIGAFKAVDLFGQTTVPGVYAAGDAGQMMPALATAVASAVTAAAVMNHTLAAEDFAQATAAL